ncbi:hypothetical protein U987_02576, partial [Staphylococcus aureus 1110904178]
NNYRGNCAFFLFKNIKIGLMNFVISPIYYRTKIKYIIGINTGANNAVVSAYEVSFEQAESIETNNGRMRYAFIGLSERDATLKKLNLYKKALPDLRFGSGSATAYINNGTMKVD